MFDNVAIRENDQQQVPLQGFAAKEKKNTCSSVGIKAALQLACKQNIDRAKYMRH